MKKLFFLLIGLLIVFLQEILNFEFAYIAYSTNNIGDDIQAIAARNFLPKDSLVIDREFIGEFVNPVKVNTIINGWYMCTKDFGWYREDIKPPQKSWPPSLSINPLLLSIHFTRKFLVTAFSEEGILYLKKYGPVGARDLYTLKKLQEHKIPSYFSGCLTLTLQPLNLKKKDIIYAVDIDDECLKYIKANAQSEVVSLTHKIDDSIKLDYEKRLQLAQCLLEKYQCAKCVITSRLHAALPCLAFDTPVLLLNVQADQYRFEGLAELVRNCSKAQFLKGAVHFDFNHPPKNPTLYIPLRENLINIVTAWVNQNKQREDLFKGRL